MFCLLTVLKCLRSVHSCVASDMLDFGGCCKLSGELLCNLSLSLLQSSHTSLTYIARAQPFFSSGSSDLGPEDHTSA